MPENDEEPGIIIVASRFLVERKIGKGSFGEVFMGVDKETGDKVAIKIVQEFPLLSIRKFLKPHQLEHS